MLVSGSLELVSLKFDTIQEIQILEEFLLSPEIAENLSCQKKERLQRRIGSFKRLEEGLQKQLELQNSYYVAVAKKNGKVFGAVMSFVFEKGLYLDFICVNNEFKNQGIEKQLLQLIYNQSGIKTIEVYTDSRDEQINVILEQLQFIPEMQFSIMEKSAENFSSVLKQSDQSITILPVSKDHDIEIDCFEIFDDKDIAKLLNNSDAKWAEKKLKTDTSFNAFCARDKDGRPVGTILYRKEDSDRLSIEILAVCKQYQRQGIAKKLLFAVQQEAFNHGIKALEISVLESNVKARNCYLSFGFVEQYKKYLMVKRFAH